MCISKVNCLSYKTLLFVSLLIINLTLKNTTQAQVVEKDSLKSDATTIKIAEKELTNDSIANLNASDTIVNAGNDTTFLLPTRKKRIASRATLYSCILPGLGQAYNGKYWKIPIIYTSLGVMVFLVANNHQKYEDFKYAYKNFKTDLKPVWVSESLTDGSYLKERMEFYKRNRNYYTILGVIVYLLNILDANVDAHLMDFDVSDDLALHIEPDMNFLMAEQKKSGFSGFGIKFVLSLNR